MKHVILAVLILAGATVAVSPVGAKEASIAGNWDLFPSNISD